MILVGTHLHWASGSLAYGDPQPGVPRLSSRDGSQPSGSKQPPSRWVIFDCGWTRIAEKVTVAVTMGGYYRLADPPVRRNGLVL